MDNPNQDQNINQEQSPFSIGGEYAGEMPKSPFDTPGMTEAGADYFLKITTLKEHHEKDEKEKEKLKKIRPEIQDINRILYIHATLANLTVHEVRMLQLAFDKKVMMVTMFLDRNTITPDEYDYIESLKTQYYLMLTRAIGVQRERITQTHQVSTRLIGEAPSNMIRDKPKGFWDWLKS